MEPSAGAVPSPEGETGVDHEEHEGRDHQVQAEMEGKGDPPQTPVLLPKPPDKQNLRHHVAQLIEQRPFPFLFPPVHLFHVGAAIGDPGGCFMLDWIDLPADMDGHGHLPVNPVAGGNDEHREAQVRQDIVSHGRFLKPQNPQLLQQRSYSNSDMAAGDAAFSMEWGSPAVMSVAFIGSSLDASRRFRKAGELARPLGRSRGKKLVNLLET